MKKQKNENNRKAPGRVNEVQKIKEQGNSTANEVDKGGGLRRGE